MWKKDDPLAPGHNPSPPPANKPPHQATNRTVTATELATIGRSITIKGEVTGDEDLLIQGRIDGSVDLKQQSVTVGQEGRVKANITGRVIVVEGEVDGDLLAEDQVVLRSTAKVEGDITAARVVLEDGASFRGGVDMGDSKNRGTPGPTTPSLTQAKKAPEAPKGLSDSEKEDSKKPTDKVSP